MESSMRFEISITENEQEIVRWAEMPPDVLVEVFKRFSVEDRLRTIPQVCQAWRKATLDPGCWQVVDVKEWCMHHSGEFIDRMIRLAVERSCGGILELHVANLESDASLQFLAQSRLSSLKALSIPSSDVTDSDLCKLIRTLPTLEHMDISKCSSVKSTALEVLGQTCKSLSRLDRVMWTVSRYDRTRGLSDDSEAMAIAEHMPKLKHLELSLGWLSETNYTAILEKCPDLDLLELDSDSDAYFRSDSDGYSDWDDEDSNFQWDDIYEESDEDWVSYDDPFGSIHPPRVVDARYAHIIHNLMWHHTRSDVV